MILCFDENTFGKRSQVISTTRVFVKCDTCLEHEWWTSYSNRKQRDSDMCQRCKNTQGICGMLGKKHSKETIDKFKDGRRAGSNNIAKRSDVREKISAKLKGRACEWLTGKRRPDHALRMRKYMNSFWTIPSAARDQRYEKLNDARISNALGHSKLHDDIKEALVENGFVDFVSEYKVGKYIVDEVDQGRQLILEVYGDFWHANPNKYNASDEMNFPSGKMRAECVWDKDNARIDFLKSNGYQVIIIWESEWKSDKNGCINRLRQKYE